MSHNVRMLVWRVVAIVATVILTSLCSDRHTGVNSLHDRCLRDVDETLIVEWCQSADKHDDIPNNKDREDDRKDKLTDTIETRSDVDVASTSVVVCIDTLKCGF